MKNLFILIWCIFLFSGFNSLIAQSSGDQLFDHSFVHEIRITFDTDNFWEILQSNYLDNATDFGGPGGIPYLMGALQVDGEVVDSVGIRQKGFESHFMSNTLKRSLKIDLNEFVSGQTFDGLKKFNLNNGLGDPSMLREVISYDVLRLAGVKAPRTSFVRLYLNDQYWGLYIAVEQIDKTFLANFLPTSGGNLYENDGFTNLDWQGVGQSAYTDEFDLKTNESENDWSDLVGFLNVLNNTTDAQFPDAIQQEIDVDNYLRILAVDVITNNWDSYADNGSNFYLYHDTDSDLFYWIPWDYNLALDGQLFDPQNSGIPTNAGDCNSISNSSSPYPATDATYQQTIEVDPYCCLNEWDGACEIQYDEIDSGQIGNHPFNSFNFPVLPNNPEKVLIDRLLNVPEFREQYLNHLCNTLANNFNTQRLDALISNRSDMIRDAVYEDPNYLYTTEIFETDVTDLDGNDITPLRGFINDRIEDLQAELNDINHECDLISSPIEWRDVVINEFMASADSLSGISDQNGQYDDWVEIYNNTPTLLDLNGFYLSDDFNDRKKWAFPSGTFLEAGGYLIVWTDSDLNQAGLHANFRLQKDGEQLILTHEDNSIIDSLTFGIQETNVPMARVPNGTGNFVQQAPTFSANNNPSSVQSLSQPMAFGVYPNPASGYFEIQLSDNIQTESIQINVYNPVGLKSSVQGIQNNRLQIESSDWSPGIYFLEVITPLSRGIRKIIIQ